MTILAPSVRRSKVQRSIALWVLILSASPGGLSLVHAWELRFEDSAASDLPGAYIYDPVTGVSRVNLGVGRFEEPQQLETDLFPNESFTVEAFAKPDPSLETRKRDYLPVFKSGGEEAFFFVGIWRSPSSHSYNWWSGKITGEGPQPIELGRFRYRGTTMVTKETPWRHLAISFDAENQRISYYVDYRLQNSTNVANAKDWDLSIIEIGGGTGKMKLFAGLIDEVRVTKGKALPPHFFLRASSVDLKDVSFAPETQPSLPEDYGHVDVRLHYGAIGDGVHDDTEAIRKAFSENDNRVPNDYVTVYFPEGTYRVTDTIRFRRFMVVRGAGKEKTKFIIEDDAPGYTDPDDPRVVFAVGYDWPYSGRTKKHRAGNAIGSYLFDFTIETGKGNHGAVAFDFHTNNVGCAENIDLISTDGSGLIGLDLKRGWPGPCLMKNMTIDGFGVGIDASHREYSLVFSDISLKNQREVAIRNSGNILSMENVMSENSVPVLENRGGGLVVFVNSTFEGGDPDTTAISSHNSSLYLQNTKFGGYQRSILETSKPKDGLEEVLHEVVNQDVSEHFTGPAQAEFQAASNGSLKLEIKQTPLLPRPALSDWVSVGAFEDKVLDGDWGPAIQAAIDSGKSLVYFPSDLKVSIKSDVRVRGAVRQFFGGSPKQGIRSEAEDPATGPALIFEEDLGVVQFDMLGTPHLLHDSPTTLVLRHCSTGHITATERCGDLFIDDSGGKKRFSQHQRVWGRQLNPETKGVPEIINNGGQVWILGLKTEYLSTKIHNLNGAKTEVLGGLMYPVHPVKDENLPMFLNEDSEISLVHATSVYSKNHQIYMLDAREGESKEHRQWNWIGGRPITNLYRSSR